jgi:hypothetical protein
LQNGLWCGLAKQLRVLAEALREQVFRQACRPSRGVVCVRGHYVNEAMLKHRASRSPSRRSEPATQCRRCDLADDPVSHQFGDRIEIAVKSGASFGVRE